MNTHSIPFSVYTQKNHPKLSQICRYEIFFQGTQERVQNNHGKQVISVRDIEVLLYLPAC